MSFGWFGRVVTFARSLLGDRVSVLVTEAMPIVELIARMTPTRADDEIIAVFKTLDLPSADAWLKAPIEERGLLLLKAGADSLAKKLPHIPYTILVAVVQLAVARLKKL
jgi:hypothetical protein